MMTFLSVVACTILLTAADEPRLNQIQVIGTHNSYHISPTPELLKILGTPSKALAQGLDYTHRPFSEQFGKLGIRQIELDVFHDPDGGFFANPSSRKTLKSLGFDSGVAPEFDAIMNRPGLKVLHVPDIDYRTTAPTFTMALKQVREWSLANPNHIPIMILVEVKDGAIVGIPTKPVPFNKAALNTVDAEIDAVFPRSEIFTPDDLRRDDATLPDAIQKRGWPKLSEVRGKVMFALDNEGKTRDDYLAGHPALKDRRMFVTPPSEAHESAAFFKINDPIRDFARIQKLVKQGYIVRTRADADTKQSRKNEPTQRNKALASGAQYVSSDYPEPRAEFSSYEVKLPNGVVARANPVSGEVFQSAGDLEAWNASK